MTFTPPAPKEYVEGITDDECASLEANTGLNPSDGLDNCEVISEQILPLIETDLDIISHGIKTIFANEDSKCKEGDENPTIASMLSRIYRMAGAFACNICTFDPELVTRLKSGRSNQVLWGQGLNQLPKWITPEQRPTAGSNNLVTSGGVYTAIQEAKLGTFHVWEDYPSFAFYAENLTDLNSQTGAVADDIALVLSANNTTNAVYSYDGSTWTFVESFPSLEDFATTHINKGTWQDDELYFFHNPDTSTASWNLLDASMGQAQQAIQQLLDQLALSVLSADSTKYLLTTRQTLAQAQAVSATAGKTTIVLITG